LARILHDFLSWQPQPPRSTAQLVRSVAKLCRLLCDEVAEAIVLPAPARKGLLVHRPAMPFISPARALPGEAIAHA
jgi:hypothetical protein